MLESWTFLNNWRQNWGHNKHVQMNNIVIMCTCRSSTKLLEKYRFKEREYWECQQLWPRVTYDDIYDYFVGRPGFDGEAVKAYKSLSAYLYVMSGGPLNVFCAHGIGNCIFL